MDHIERAIAHYEAKIEIVRQRLQMFEEEKKLWGAAEDIGQRPPRDMTDETVAADKQLIESAEHAIKLLRAM